MCANAHPALGGWNPSTGEATHLHCIGRSKQQGIMLKGDEGLVEREKGKFGTRCLFRESHNNYVIPFRQCADWGLVCLSVTLHIPCRMTISILHTRNLYVCLHKFPPTAGRHSTFLASTPTSTAGAAPGWHSNGRSVGATHELL